MIGQSINHYKITAKLGEGGMGEVYRATDTQLGREVALKILPEKFIQDRQRMSRFQREAEVLASLNHPHISIIHDLEESGEVRALVLELVEGLTLAERIAKGPLPVEEALQVALEISRALEAAHENGIVHRDLKPANIKITPERTVKVLDFGLAKALEKELSQQELANSPTLTLEATQEGMILGTAPYMSPEQARGQALDKRTDIFSFGLVLFEMLTGKGMYEGKSLAETLAAVIHQEPSLEELPENTPRPIRELLERCLRKDPRMRLRDMGDARIALEECLAGTAEEHPVSSFIATPLWKRLAPWAVVPLALVLAGVVRWWWTPIPEKPTTRWEMPLDRGQMLGHEFRRGVAFSPDGSQLAYDVGSRDPRRTIYLRSLDRWDAVLLADTYDLYMPFFSPDGKWLGVFSSPRGEAGAETSLQKYPLDGGLPSTLCDCERPFGASWASDDTIIFACKANSGLWRVSAQGGEPEQITELDQEAEELSHRLPDVLPNGKAVLFTVVKVDTISVSKAQIAVLSLETGKRKLLIEDAFDARYVPSGHLVFAREGTVWAAPFDRTRLELTGPEVRVLEGISQALYTGNGGTDTGAAQFAFSNFGSLAYIGGSVVPEKMRDIVWVDLDGVAEVVGIPPAQYHGARLSPDGSQVLRDTSYKDKQIWTYDLERRARSIETPEGRSRFPIWFPDSTAITFDSDRNGVGNLFSKAINRVGAAEPLLDKPHGQVPGSWSPDGKTLAFIQSKPATEWDSDIWILSMESPRSAQPFLETSFRETSPEFSPDGRWLAYVSDETGRREVYVDRYPDRGQKKTISTSGGNTPVWSMNGDKLFYFTGFRSPRPRKFWGVDIAITGDALEAGIPAVLFERECVTAHPHRSFDVTPDGQRFLIVDRPEAKERLFWKKYFGTKVNIVLNWFEELERLAPRE